MLRLKALLEQKLSLAAQIKALAEKVNTENREFTAEEKGEWDKVNDAFDATGRQIEIKQRADTVSKFPIPGDRNPGQTINTPTNSDEADRANALAGWLCQGKRNTPERQEAMERLGVSAGDEITLKIGSTGDFNANREQFLATHPNRRRGLGRGPGAASLLTSTTTAAGYLIAPGSLYNSLELARLYYGAVLPYADVIRTPNGEAFSWPSANDTSNTGEILAEVADIGNTVNPAIGRTTLNAYKFSSKLIRFSHEMAEDSAFNLMSLLGDMLGERLGRVGNTYQTVGTGSSQPYGVVAGATAGVTFASATAITADEIIDLYHALGIAYRPNAAFMAADATLKALRKLKSAQGEYLWSAGGLDAGIAGDFSDRLFGKPVITNTDMPAATTGLKSILFGDYSKFKVREVNEVRLRVLNELYAATDEIGVIAFMRWDSKLLNAGTNPVVYGIQA